MNLQTTLSKEEMVAAVWAQECIDMANPALYAGGKAHFNTPEEAAVGWAESSQELAADLAQYRQGIKILARYNMVMGKRRFALPATVRVQDEVDTAKAASVFLVFAGFIATAPTYRLVAFYRKERVTT